ncbi:MAG TPA: MFS transporter [Pararobbsia sp.]|nr:MFS transporter [Pararobbsia sp.]
MTDKATSIDLLSVRGPAMRAFHLAWLAFFVCFFAWFACAPLMPLIKQEFKLTADQIANINIAAVAITILVRVIVGPLCDRFGPRKVYVGLLLLGTVPLVGAALSQSYLPFLLCRLGIGAVGASFVITQYHTSVMFANKIVGTANATSAGFGNAGAGAAQLLVPVMLAACVAWGATNASAWRLTLLVPAVAMPIVAWFYWRLTQDCPQGNYSDLRARGVAVESGKKGGWQSLGLAARNYRVWMLFVTYGACFGVEVSIHNIAALYYVEHFHASLAFAGLAAGCFGLLAIVARPLGGIVSDWLSARRGLSARIVLLCFLIAAEGAGLLVFAHANDAAGAFAAMLLFGLMTHMACGATYAIVPFVDRKALGGVAGIVGAGGNTGAVAAGFLFKGVGDVHQALVVLAVVVMSCAVCALAVRLSTESVASDAALPAAN